MLSIDGYHTVRVVTSTLLKVALRDRESPLGITREFMGSPPADKETIRDGVWAAGKIKRASRKVSAISTMY